MNNKFKWQEMDSAPKDGTEILVLKYGIIYHVKWKINWDGWFCLSDNNFVENPMKWMELPI